MREEVLKQMLERADKEHPVTREQIMNTFKVSERKARKMIEELRRMGVRVCGLNTTEGYWIAKNQKEYERFRRDYLSKATTIIQITSNMDNQSEEGQVTFLDLL